MEENVPYFLWRGVWVKEEIVNISYFFYLNCIFLCEMKRMFQKGQDKALQSTETNDTR